MVKSPLDYFTDAVLRAPTIGCILMCFAASLVGVIVVLRKQSLIGEALSHASYPGVILGVIFAAFIGIEDSAETAVALFIIAGAFLSALLGLYLIYGLERKLKVKSDSALCFILSAFFGIGLTLASEVQFSHTSFYRQVQVYLYGQAATMTNIHIYIYGLLALAVLTIILLFYKEIQAIIFDRNYAKSLGINTKPIDALIFILIVLAVVIGIRSVGVVLMSAMLIAPAVAARQYTNQLSLLFVLSALFGMTSGYLGNYFSVEGTYQLSILYPRARLALPTGPMIVIVASTICILSLLFAPERGFVWRSLRIYYFRHRSLSENLLKTLWHADHSLNFAEITRFQSANKLYLNLIVLDLIRNGWVKKKSDKTLSLTPEGQAWAAKIVRLHRLWEVYLVDYLGVGAEKVHRSAEEMEHLITPELEEELILLLKNPTQDPHHQPIPPP
jgi:manganese/zinc/iron transport system permease protein